jgi:hypothetical protein
MIGNLFQKRVFLKVIVVVLSIFLVSSTGSEMLLSQAELVLYGSNAVGTSVILGNWGTGVCQSSTKNMLGGVQSIQITPRGLYQGGRLDFATPVDLTKWFNDPEAYLQLVVKFYDVAESSSPGTAWGLVAPSSRIAASRTGKIVRRLQIMLFFDSGESTECQVDVNAFKPSPDAWVNVSFPFVVLKGKLDLPAYNVKRIVITGDGTEPFYIGEIRVVRDNTPIEANAGDEKEVARNYPVVFTGSATGGASALRYSWDFDNTDGIQEEAVGETVTHRFRRAGYFVVTLTVSDVFGLKKPAVATTRVYVNE